MHLALATLELWLPNSLISAEAARGGDSSWCFHVERAAGRVFLHVVWLTHQCFDACGSLNTRESNIKSDEDTLQRRIEEGEGEESETSRIMFVFSVNF